MFKSSVLPVCKFKIISLRLQNYSHVKEYSHSNVFVFVFSERNSVLQRHRNSNFLGKPRPICTMEKRLFLGKIK